MSEDNQRPRRQRRPPVRLEDYEVDIPQSLANYAVLNQRLHASHNKIRRNYERAVDLVDNKGNKSVLQSCRERITDAFNSMHVVCTNVMPTLEHDGQAKMEQLLDDMEEQVEELRDEIVEHLDEREDEESGGSYNANLQRAASTPRRPGANPRPPTPNATRIPRVAIIPDQAEDLDERDNADQRDPDVQNEHDDHEELPPDHHEESDSDETWTTAASVEMSVVNRHLVEALERLSARGEVPATSPMVFDGDASKYLPFKKNFTERVGSRAFSDSFKLAQLVACTTGKAREAIEGYVGQEDGYENAHAVLKQRFGQPFKIVNAMLKKIEQQDRIPPNDGEKLQSFSDKLRAQFHQLKSMKMLKEADNLVTMETIFGKLPPREQGRWVDLVRRREEQGTHPRLEDLVKFVAEQATRTNHSVYKVAGYSRKPPSSKPPDSQSRDNQPQSQPARHPISQRPSTFSTQPGYDQPFVPLRGPRMSVPPGSLQHSGPPSLFFQSPLNRSMNQPGQRRLGDDRQPPRGPPGRPRDPCVFCFETLGQTREHNIVDCPVFYMKDVTERRQFVSQFRLCFSCLGPHFLRSCRKPNQTCTVPNCTGLHHRLLHESVPSRGQRVQPSDRRQPPPSQQNGQRSYNYNAQHVNPAQGSQTDMPPGQQTNNTGNQTHTETGAAIRPESTDVLLRIVPVRVVSEGRSATTYALLDTGASCSMMSKTLAAKLQLHGRPHQLKLNTVVARGQPVPVQLADVTLKSVCNDASYCAHNINIVESLSIDELHGCQADLDLSSWEHLRDVNLYSAEVDVPVVSLLIGEDIPQAHVVMDTVYGSDAANQPYAVKTPFGWCIAGPARKQDDEQTGAASTTQGLAASSYIQVPPVEMDSLELQLRRLWDEERHGFSNDDAKTLSVEDKRALHIMDSQTRLVDGQYEVPLLWKHDVTTLPNNYVAAFKCLQSLKKKFSQRPDFARMYREMVDNYIAKGYARLLTPEEARRSGPRTMYLPHQGEENINKPGKVRVVFNAAFQYRKTSLNSALMHGPDLNNNMLGTCLRFRQYRFAIQGDIAEMFHQVKVPNRDTDSLRFLWWREEGDVEPSVFRMERHIFGATDSPCSCVYALQRTARDNAHLYAPEVAETVCSNMYVDDLAKSCPTEQAAVSLAKDLITMLERGGFTITKFVSNSEEILQSLPPDRIAPACREKSLSEMPDCRALGIKWKVTDDMFSVKVNNKDKPLTRRGCLSFICSINDPFGMIAPVTLVGKQIVQDACRRELTWDENLPKDLVERWCKWKGSLDCLAEIQIPRCYSGRECPDRIVRTELHHFCDASESGYGSVSYMRIEWNDGTIHCSFVLGKARTAPLRFLSMPRLELQAAVVASRVHRFITREIGIQFDEVYFWCDSTPVLQYIRNTSRRFKTYVSARIEEIHDSSEPAQWRYCPTSCNPADVASRGIVGTKLAKTSWILGPSFLQEPMQSWPVLVTVPPVPSADPELKTSRQSFAATCSVPTPFEQLVSYYSTWEGLVHAIAWIQKITECLRVRLTDKRTTLGQRLELDDIDRAIRLVIEKAQQSAYASELSNLQRGLDVRNDSKIRALAPMLENGFLRVGGRLAEAPLSFEERHPVILPKDHPVTIKLIRYMHVYIAHAGPDHTLQKLREEYWIVGGKSVIKQVIRDCFLCKRFHGRLMTQLMSDLPEARVTPHLPPFHSTGCDCFGPLLIKRGRTTRKAYGIIFTCFSTRLITLDLLETMDAESFILALLRITSCYAVKKIWCDNGSNFVGGAREIGAVIESAETPAAETLKKKGIAFKFQTPYAPHKNGVWERLIRSVKLTMKAILGNSLVSFEVLRTIFAQVQGILNSRPITPLSDDVRDLNALTPNHFIMQRPFNDIIEQDDIDPYRRRWKASLYYTDQCWKRWLKEYLPVLQMRRKWQRPMRNAQIGDLVLLAEDGYSRAQWPLARIEQVQTGTDGRVRSVTVRTARGTYRRPVTKICLLEAVS